MTTISLTDVVRIDIMEGPNFEGLVQPWLMLSTLGEVGGPSRVEEVLVQFDEVAYFLEDGSKLPKEWAGEISRMHLLGIEPLGGALKSIKGGDVVITVSALGMTFKGHYNTRKRKGSLLRQRDTV